MTGRAKWEKWNRSLRSLRQASWAGRWSSDYFVYLQFEIEKCNQLQNSIPKMKQVY